MPESTTGTTRLSTEADNDRKKSTNIEPAYDASTTTTTCPHIDAGCDTVFSSPCMMTEEILLGGAGSNSCNGYTPFGIPLNDNDNDSNNGVTTQQQSQQKQRQEKGKPSPPIQQSGSKCT